MPAWSGASARSRAPIADSEPSPASARDIPSSVGSSCAHYPIAQSWPRKSCGAKSAPLPKRTRRVSVAQLSRRKNTAPALSIIQTDLVYHYINLVKDGELVYLSLSIALHSRVS